LVDGDGVTTDLDRESVPVKILDGEAVSHGESLSSRTRKGWPAYTPNGMSGAGL
jgi:hypothetical protein